jgi:hypothetical protein
MRLSRNGSDPGPTRPGSVVTDLGEDIASFGRVAIPVIQAVVGWVMEHL